eukprot:CAMPEP_0195633588 /NCGR_PEP_ID=MMETSP0815-20121206/22222_1 /TAXON_ID=97485 /ORGANISM="Prymnesium parvum, Strain Texoma1" /LENGTH=64 /DNA_ID=CAMNT_0040775253 /DNA_START=552 /DNA_END=746 /DNA_ORIENTATION=-
MSSWHRNLKNPRRSPALEVDQAADGRYAVASRQAGLAMVVHRPFRPQEARTATSPEGARQREHT